MTDSVFALPRVGVGVVVTKNDLVLLGKRLDKNGQGEYAGPGGHLEYGESIVECAHREVYEETGIEIHNVRFLTTSNLLQGGRHYVDIGLVADWKAGTPLRKEPEKVASWDWYPLHKLPRPLFSAEPHYFRALAGDMSLLDFHHRIAHI